MLNQNTKGCKKIKNYFRELLVNEKFLKEIGEISRLLDAPLEEMDKVPDDIERQIKIICIRYCLSYDEFYKIIDFISIDDNKDRDIEKFLSQYWEKDVCSISDNYRNNLVEEDAELYNIPVLGNIKYETYYGAYPISIDIRLLASKKDLKDFIDKNWDKIEFYMDWYRHKKDTDIRTHKNTEISDFVWKFRDLPPKKLMSLINKNKSFAKTLGYDNVYNIKSAEKKRRNKNLKKF